MTLGERISQARAASGLSQEQLARQIRVATVTPSRWERDKHRPLPHQLPAIAAALGVDVEWLLQDEQAAVAPSVAEGPLESAFRAWLLGTLDDRIKSAVQAAIGNLHDRRRAQLPVSEYRRKGDPVSDERLRGAVSA